MFLLYVREKSISAFFLPADASVQQHVREGKHLNMSFGVSEKMTPICRNKIMQHFRHIKLYLFKTFLNLDSDNRSRAVFLLLSGISDWTLARPEILAPSCIRCAHLTWLLLKIMHSDNYVCLSYIITLAFWNAGTLHDADVMALETQPHNATARCSARAVCNKVINHGAIR